MSPFDNYHVIAGQGTIAKEIFDDVPDLDHIVLQIGGGGLISGVAIATHSINPKCRVHGVEPEGGNDAFLSVQTGKIVNMPGQKTIAEGAMMDHLGERNLPIIQKYVDRIVNVKDATLIELMRFIGERCKVVVEPTGCLGIAGVQQLIREGVIKPGERVAVLLSGGSIDMTRYSNLLLYGTDDEQLIMEKMAHKLSQAKFSSQSTAASSGHTSENEQTPEVKDKRHEESFVNTIWNAFTRSKQHYPPLCSPHGPFFAFL